MSPHEGADERDYAAAVSVVDEIGRVTLEVVQAWPLHRHPRTDDELTAHVRRLAENMPVILRLGRLVDQHGLFTALSVALGWAGVQVRDLLNASPGANLQPGSYDLTYLRRVKVGEVDAVVAKLLEHALIGVDGVPRLYDAAELLRLDPRESVRVLVGVLDLCAALREHAVIAGRRW